MRHSCCRLELRSDTVGLKLITWKKKSHWWIQESGITPRCWLCFKSRQNKLIVSVCPGLRPRQRFVPCCASKLLAVGGVCSLYSPSSESTGRIVSAWPTRIEAGSGGSSVDLSDTKTQLPEALQIKSLPLRHFLNLGWIKFNLIYFLPVCRVLTCVGVLPCPGSWRCDGTEDSWTVRWLRSHKSASSIASGRPCTPAPARDAMGEETLHTCWNVLCMYTCLSVILIKQEAPGWVDRFDWQFVGAN